MVAAATARSSCQRRAVRARCLRWMVVAAAPRRRAAPQRARSRASSCPRAVRRSAVSKAHRATVCHTHRPTLADAGTQAIPGRQSRSSSERAHRTHREEEEEEEEEEEKGV
jgi:hypothetical protein